MEQIEVKIIEPLAVKFIMGILIILYITGCSDMPYTGSILTHEVDRYLVSTDGNAVCFQDDLDETCLELTREIGNGVNATHGPNVHIYPEDHVYLFYYEGKPIVRAERAYTPTSNAQNGNDNGTNGNNGNNNGNNANGTNGNTNGNNNGTNADDRNDGNNGNNNGTNTGDRNGGNNGNNSDGTNADDRNGGNNGNNNGTNTGDRNGGNNGNNNNNNDNNADDGHGWIIWVYYPDGVAPQNPPTLSESGATITINGKLLADEDITGFAQFVAPTGEKGIQFFYPTQSAELLDLKVQIEDAIDREGTAKFNLNYLWKAQ